MNVEHMCAASDREAQWEQVNWSQGELRVRRLQARIVKATQEGRHGKAKALQWLLTHSFYGRALAVKRHGAATVLRLRTGSPLLAEDHGSPWRARAAGAAR